MSATKKSFQYGDHTVTIETGELARQADGAVLVTMSETVVLVTAVGLKKATPGRDFFPLTVNYQEKTYAAGRIPGGFFKREGRPTEKETLTSRLIDRPIRPLSTTCRWLPRFSRSTRKWIPISRRCSARPRRLRFRACRSWVPSVRRAWVTSAASTSSIPPRRNSGNRNSISSSPAPPKAC